MKHNETFFETKELMNTLNNNVGCNVHRNVLEDYKFLLHICLKLE